MSDHHALTAIAALGWQTKFQIGTESGCQAVRGSEQSPVRESWEKVLQWILKQPANQLDACPKGRWSNSKRSDRETKSV